MTEDTLYEEALEATFISDKADVCRRLADLGTPAAVQSLVRLLDDDSSWNQQGAIAGLVTIASPEVTQVLVDHLSDPMIDDAIRDGLSAHLDRHVDALTEIYLKSEGEQAQALLELVGASPQGEAFLLAEIETGSRRVEALELLSKHHPEGNTSYVSGFLEDPESRTTVLAHLVEHGDAVHLPHFLAVLKAEAPDEQVILAFEAVARWADEEQKREICLWGLEAEEGIAQAAIAGLVDVRSDAVCAHLVRWMAEGSAKTRMLAAERLAAQGTTEHVPVLISFLSDQWTGRERGLFDGILGVLTIGIVPLLQQLGEHMSKKRLVEAQGRVAVALQRLTGHAEGNAYEAWRIWAIHQGYTIDGTNLLQALFSGDVAVRQDAEEAACELLRIRPSEDPHERLLTLARGLLKHGVLDGPSDDPSRRSRGLGAVE